MPPLRALNSDELGEKGESRFAEICNDVKLICNPSRRDRTGWDFIVESRTFNDATASLDKRQSAFSCRVQVKTIWSPNDRCSLRLSSAELLAKSVDPAFIYVFRVSDNLEFVESYLIHLLDTNLSTVLRRLRSEHAAGSSTINHMRISFQPSMTGKMINPTGADLLTALTEACGSDPATYSINKSEQLRNLGFEHGPKLKVGFQVANREHIADVFLGRRPATVTKYDQFESRFGIELPVFDGFARPEEMMLSPLPAATGIFSVRAHALSAPVNFNVEIFVPPFLEFEETKILIKSRFFDFEFVGKTGSCEFNAFGPDLGLRYSIGDLIDFLRMMLIFESGAAVILVSTSNGHTLPLPSPIPHGDSDTEPLQAVLTRLEYLREIQNLVGISQAEVSIDEVRENEREIDGFAELLLGKPESPSLSFRSGLPENDRLPSRFDLLYISYLTLGVSTIALHAVATVTPELHGDHLLWRSEKIRLINFSTLQNVDADYERYIERAKTSTGIDHCMIKPGLVQSDGIS